MSPAIWPGFFFEVAVFGVVHKAQNATVGGQRQTELNRIAVVFGSRFTALKGAQFRYRLVKRTVIALMCYAVATTAAGDVQVGRYAVIPPTATGPQQFPLLAVSQYRFPSSIRTISDAIEFVLLQTGYALAPATSRDPRAETMLAAPLPRVQRDLGPIRVDHALRALAGPGFELVVDPIHRLVAFDVAARAWLQEGSMQDVNAPAGRERESRP